MPSGPLAGRLVGDQLPDVVDQQAHGVTASIARRSSAGTSDGQVPARHGPPPGRRPRLLTSAAVAAKPRRRGRTPAVRTLSSAYRHQVGARARGDPPGVGPAQRGVPGGGGRQQFGRGEVAAPLGAQPLVQLHRPGLLEQVDHRVAVAAEAQRAAGVGQRPGRPDPVGQIPFGGGAEAHPGPVLAEQRSGPPRSGGWRVPPWCPGPSTPSSASSAVGVRPCYARQASFSARCSERWTCSGAPLRAQSRHRRASGRPAPPAPSGPPRRPGHVVAGPEPVRRASAQRPRPRRRSAAAARRAAPVHRGGQVEVSSRVIRMPASAAASTSAAPIAFGSSYGRPPGRWCR